MHLAIPAVKTGSAPSLARPARAGFDEQAGGWPIRDPMTTPEFAGIERRSDQKKRILVLGAGIAGLTAAYQLVRVGHDVTVLEAQDRVGGKILTLRHPDHTIDPPFHAEAGALVLPPEMPLTLQLADHLAVSHDQLPPARQELHLRGRSMGDGNSVSTRWPVRIRRDERKLGAQKMWRKYFTSIAPTLGNPAAAGWPNNRVARFDRITLTEFLRSRGASAGAIEILRLRRHDLLGDGMDAGSALQWLRELALFPVSGIPRYFPGGSDGLPKALEKKLAGRIELATPVVAIEETGSTIAAVCGDGSRLGRVEADEMICTIPFSVLRTMTLPPMPREKQRAIDLLQYTSLVRLYLQTSSPVWKGGELTFTDRMPMLVSRADQRHAGTSKGLIEVYISGRYARALQALPDAQRVDRVLSELESLSPGVRAAYEKKFAIHCWDEDRWAGGAYPWYLPGDMTALAPHAATPVGRLHFAGEHTSLAPGWIHGAIESGTRAAAEVA
jgi:monoamine oxidase